MPIPVFGLEFNKDAKPVNKAQEEEAIRFLNGEGAGTTDVLVLSHGWNNDMAEARDLYDRLLHAIESQLPGGTGRTFAALGIFWPSKRFADKELIPGGAAGFDSSNADAQQALEALDTLKAALDTPESAAVIDELTALIPRLEGDTAAQDEFVAKLLGLNPSFDPEDDESGPAGQADHRVLELLGAPDLDFDGPPPSSEGGAAGFGNFFGGIFKGAGNATNLITYYQMKERAGFIGGQGANAVIARIQAAVPQRRFHYAGHSFGARLVTGLVDGPRQVRASTLSLLQGAFSHNAFSGNLGKGKQGKYRAVIEKKKVTGPILVTHSVQDSAVSMAYPLASRLQGEDAAGFTGFDPAGRWGGMGGNGAQNTAEADFLTLLPAGGAYQFKTGRIHNLNGDKVITGHGDIARPETGHAIVQAILAAGASSQ
ncbi:MAG: hypothetical protein FJW40_24105 [Acidobacteria bacterium]|nr:hypothetical protein [Acidobacteriota bacterium]